MTTDLERQMLDANMRLHECANRLLHSFNDAADWWTAYWEARLALREMALRVISNPDRESHPDRRSADFKAISQDITDDMKNLMDPEHGHTLCPGCGEMTTSDPCFVCWVKAQLKDGEG